MKRGTGKNFVLLLVLVVFVFQKPELGMKFNVTR